LMRLHWEEIIPKPPTPKATSKRVKNIRITELGDVADSEFAFLFSEADSWRTLSDDDPSDGTITSSTCSLSEALTAVLSSPLVIALYKIKSRIVDADCDLSDARAAINIQTSFSLIFNKVDSGKTSYYTVLW